MNQRVKSLLSIFSPPALLTIVGFLIPNASVLVKGIIIFGLLAFYFFGLSLYYAYKIQDLESENCKIGDKKILYSNKIEKYDKFRHRREIFINHDLEKLGRLLTEYNGFVKDEYRGRKFVVLRYEAETVKERVIEIIHAEKRNFDADIYDIQSDKNNWWV